MDFFEQLGKRLSDAGQNVAQQTQNFTEINRLNGLIAEKGRRVSQLYTDMGRRYYEAHKADPAADYPELIGEINNLFAEIAQSRDRINQIKGIPTCPKCGAVLAPNASFCGACGTPMQDAAVSGRETIQDTCYCPSCFREVAKGAVFCSHCGAKLEQII